MWYFHVPPLKEKSKDNLKVSFVKEFKYKVKGRVKAYDRAIDGVGMEMGSILK